MTREEAHDIARTFPMEQFNKARNLVIDIYRDFESRTCENCKYFYETVDIFGECHNGVFYNSLTDVVATFGCNKWEAK